MYTKRILCLAASSILFASCAEQQKPPADADGRPAAPEATPRVDARPDASLAAAQIDGWPKASREAIDFMTDKYGPPAAVTADAAIWGGTGPWKRTIVFKNEVPHSFPKQHTDVMQQWIDYRAPLDMYDELAMYDGSVVLERTSGEMSARCDKEAANFLALNLADEVARGERTVDDARTKYGEQVKAMMAGKPAPYTEGLMFTVSGGTEDPDQSLPGM